MKSFRLIICLTFMLSNALKSFSASPTLVINNPAAVCFPATVDLTASSITAGSSPGLNYTWWINEEATIPFTTPASAGEGTYYLKGTNASGESATGSVQVVVNPLQTPEVSISSSLGTSVCAGTSVTFSAINVHGETPAYQWRKGNTNIPGATASTYTTSSLVNGNSVSVVMTTQNSCATSTVTPSNTIVMIVSPNVTPTIAINVLENTVCTGITYASVITNGGSTPAYQWLLNDEVIEGATESTYTAKGLSNNNRISCRLTSNALCALPATVKSNSLKVSLTVPTTTWLGLSSNFNAASNWSNGIPNSNLSAIINLNTPYQPVLSNTATVYNLIINPGATFTINGSNSLTIYGSFTNNGIFTPNNSTVIFTGCSGTLSIAHTISCEINATTTFNDLTLNDVAGVNLNCNGALTGCLSLINGTFKNNNKVFTLLSTKKTKAYISSASSAASFSGNITTQCIVSGTNKGWATIGSPVSGAVLNKQYDNPADLTNTATGENKKETFDTLIASNSLNPLNVGVGYLTYLGNEPDTNDINIELTGTPTIGDFNFSPSFTSSAKDANGFNLIANPYPGEIDWTSTAWSKSNVNEAIYIYQADKAQYGTYINGISTNGGSHYIAASQGFYVQANGTNPVLIATEKVKSGKDNKASKQSEPAVTDKLIRVKLTGNNCTDEAVIRFNESASMQFDPNFDALKMHSPDKKSPSIATLSENKEFSVNTLPPDTDLNIPVKVMVKKSGTYTISFDGATSFPSNQCLLFEDSYAHSKTAITNSASYTFTISDTTIAPRFLIHIASPLKVVATDVNCGNTADGTISMKEGNTAMSFELYNAEDSLINFGKVTNVNTIISSLQAGNFVLQLNNGMGCSNMKTPVTIGTKTTLPAFENNNTVFIEKGEAYVTLTDTTAKGDSYLWDFGDSEILGSITPTATHTYTKEGRYNVSITSDKGGIKQEKKLVLDVFNKPAYHNTMDIQTVNGEYYAVFRFDKITEVSIQIVNMNGQLLAAPLALEGTVGCKKIETPDISTGFCVIRISDGKTTFNKKITFEGLTKL